MHLTPQDRENIGQFLGRLWGRMHKRGCPEDIREAHDTIQLLMNALSAKEESYDGLAEAHSLCHPKIAQLEAQISHPLPPLDPSQVENEQR